jgi:hypothetical protein
MTVKFVVQIVVKDLKNAIEWAELAESSKLIVCIAEFGGARFYLPIAQGP